MEPVLNIIKALAQRSRLRVIMILMRQDELCVCQIVELLGVATATVSRHMSILQNARLVRSRKEGRWVYYGLSEHFPGQLRKWLNDSLLKTEEIQADQALLETIMSCSPEDLCRKQKEKEEGNESEG